MGEIESEIIVKFMIVIWLEFNGVSRVKNKLGVGGEKGGQRVCASGKFSLLTIIRESSNNSKTHHHFINKFISS